MANHHFRSQVLQVQNISLALGGKQILRDLSFEIRDIYRPETVTVQVGSAGTIPVDVNLTRTAPMAAAGIFLCDSHLHLNRLTEEDDQLLFDRLEAADFRYCAVLANNDVHPDTS